MTDPKTLQLLWQYRVPADEQVLAAAVNVDDKSYHCDQGILAGSIHDLLVHCMSAQTSWLQRLRRVANPWAAWCNAG